MSIGNFLKFSLLAFAFYAVWNSLNIPKETIYKKDYGNKWAFTSDMAMLECFQDSTGKMPVVVVKGKAYGLTGYADNRHGQKNLEAFNEVWLMNAYNTSHVDIGIFQAKAKELCD